MEKSPDEPEPSETSLDSSNSGEADRPGNHPASEEDKLTPQSSPSGEAVTGAPDWWSAQPSSDWAQPDQGAPAIEPVIPREAATADVYFCGHTTLLSLNQALQAIANEKLTGALRAFWDQESIELLAQDGGIVFATTRDLDLYCPDAPVVLSNVDTVLVDRARNQQRETGTPFFLTLARDESIGREPALELVQHYGQRVFSVLWTAPRVWIMFEKNAEPLSDVGDVPAEASLDDWALESLRFVQTLDQPVSFEPTSIPAYTKDGYERIQKLKLTADEARFASQFNGTRSVQQIAKNLRLDLKSANLMMFRFLALELVECWTASTVTKPESKSFFQRFKRSMGRGSR